MYKIFIDAIKKHHTIYENIRSTSSNLYCFTDSFDDADIVFVALEDASGNQRIIGCINKPFYLYYEDSSFLNYVDMNLVCSSSNFLGAISHSIDSYEKSKDFFDCCYYMPVGVVTQDVNLIRKRLLACDKPTFIFWGSWSDVSNGNFAGRGGLYADVIFENVRKYIDCNLIIKSPYNLRSMDLYPDSVQCFSSYQSIEKLNELQMQSSFLLLPSVAAHFATIPIGMSFGLPCICNNNWGFEENVKDGYNGLKVDCLPPGHGNYETLNYDYVNKISEKIIDLIKNKNHFYEMSMNAVNTQIESHNIVNYPSIIDSILNELTF